jgi:hypothetical protein
MRNALAVAGVLLAITASCSRPTPKMQPDPDKGYMLQTTGAVVGRDDPNRNEPDPTLGEVATRLAGQICERETRCHGDAVPIDRCMRTFTQLTALEVAKWPCSPAATRSRAKECLASLNAEPCEMDITTKPELCPVSDACPDPNAGLISPGAVTAKVLEAREAAGTRTASFDYEAAVRALAAVDLRPCLDKEGPKGTAHVVVSFAPDGGVLNSTLDKGPAGSGADLWGTPRGECLLERFRSARVPLFDGPPQEIGVAIPLE